MTLSSLYLDIIKDRLYCDGADSAARRSAQSALWIILDAMTKVFAPILAFTCDEIWLQMPHRNGDDGRNVLLNQMSKPYTDYALLDTEMAVWETALRVRSDVNGVLETEYAREFYSRLAVEIMKAVNFYHYNNRDRELKELYLCGGGAAIMALRETVADTVNLTVRGGEELLDEGMRPAEEPWLYLRAIGSVCEGGLK